MAKQNLERWDWFGSVIDPFPLSPKNLESIQRLAKHLPVSEARTLREIHYSAGTHNRTSAATMRANQLRLWFASAAYVLLCALRRIGLAHTQFADATCGTIRLKLLKIGALVKISVRRVAIAMASACPWQHEFALAHAMLRRAGA